MATATSTLLIPLLAILPPLLLSLTGHLTPTTMLQPWSIFLLTLSSLLLFLYAIYRLLLLRAPSLYAEMIAHNSISVDDFVGEADGPSAGSALKSWLLNRFNVGERKAFKEKGEDGRYKGYKLKAVESDKVTGLKVTYRAKDGEESANASAEDDLPPIVVGTIRMGFGHHRIAYAATSWGLGSTDLGKENESEGGTEARESQRQTWFKMGGNNNRMGLGRETWFHDFLNIESEEAKMIKDMDKSYSKGSRLASELGGPVEKFWGALTKSGDQDSLRITYQFSEHMIPLLSSLPLHSPIIATHSMVACAAVAAGFKNVINLVIDNHAQWFVVVPGALNLVQGFSNYHSFLKMGVPEEMLGLAGHWIPRDLVEGIPAACERRKMRRKGKKPLRIIIPVGGAGAQRKFIVQMVGAFKDLVKEGRVQLFLNAGDHVHMKEAFVEALEKGGMEYDTVVDMKGVKGFRERMLTEEPKKNVTLFTYDDYFTAVATTDILCNVADVLACKPSELAFYPIPKLMIRRVGDHEAYSALRASELGDGTLEVREVPLAVKYVKLFLETDLLCVMNDLIEKNNEIGVYDGCKNAVRIALERAEKMAKEE